MQDRGTATWTARRSRRNLGTFMGVGLLLILKGLLKEGLELGVGSGLIASTMSVLRKGSCIIVQTRTRLQVSVHYRGKHVHQEHYVSTLFDEIVDDLNFFATSSLRV